MSPSYHSSLARRVRRLFAVLGGLNLATLLLLLASSQTYFQAISPFLSGVGGRSPQFFVALIAALMILAALFWFVLPWGLFRWIIQARCPACGEHMRLEISHPPRYYCHDCGNCADDGTMHLLAHTPVPPPRSLAEEMERQAQFEPAKNR